MSGWIILLVLAVACSPLIWLRPSPGQSRRMDIRLAARRLGLGMQLAQQDWPHWLPTLPPSPCPQYFLPRRRALEAWSYWQVAPGRWLDQWREECADGALLERFRRLPEDVYKVEASRQMITLFWAERGGEEQLREIAAVLGELA